MINWKKVVIVTGVLQVFYLLFLGIFFLHISSKIQGLVIKDIPVSKEMQESNESVSNNVRFFKEQGIVLLVGFLISSIGMISFLKRKKWGYILLSFYTAWLFSKIFFVPFSSDFIFYGVVLLFLIGLWRNKEDFNLSSKKFTYIMVLGFITSVVTNLLPF